MQLDCSYVLRRFDFFSFANVDWNDFLKFPDFPLLLFYVAMCLL